MAKQNLNQTLLLLKEQGTFGTKESALTGTDVLETIGAAKLKFNPNNTPIDLVAGSMDQDALIPGMCENELSFSIYARAAAADDVGQFGRCLRCSAMTETESSDGIFDYVFTSVLGSMTDFTAWLYSGNADASGSILRKAYNGILSPKWMLEAGKPATMECSSKLTFEGIGAVATMPAITKERTLPSALIGASTLTINGDSDYGLLSCEIDPQQEIVLTQDPTETYGMGLSVVTNRKIKWKAKVYKDLPATVDPETALLNKTLAALTIEWGTAPQKVKFSGDYAQINEIDHSDESGVECWDLSGSFVRNDFTIRLSTK